MTNDKMLENSKNTRYWYALYTRPRFEKKVDAELKLKKLESFLPVRSVVRYWSDRKKRIDEPLFPSYVFIHGNVKERYLSLQTYGVVRMVCFNGHPTRIPDEQIESIHRILALGYDPEPHQYLNYGDEVEVVASPLRGLRGIYLEERRKNRLVISIHAIQQSIAVEVDRGLVRRVRSAQQLISNRSTSKYRLQTL
ncbi:MAG: UpxY family transcription antiterminator [bacterium]